LIGSAQREFMDRIAFVTSFFWTRTCTISTFP
jgi:hypothetical protein